jgi:hypothetical protein
VRQCITQNAMICGMRSSFLLFLILSCLFGAGCTVFQPITFSPPPSTLGEPSPDGPVAFRRGFGALPGNSPQNTPSKTPFTVVMQIPLPSLPNEVTVLRERSTEPADTLLRNITTAFHIPAGVVGPSTRERAAAVSWTSSSDHLRWTYDTQTNTLHAERTASAAGSMLTTPLSEDQIVGRAETVFHALGIDRNHWGHAVMTSSTGPWKTVLYPATQDEQLIRTRDGAVVAAGTARIHEASLELDALSATLPTDVDRSNYPSITSQELFDRLRTAPIDTTLLNTNPTLTVTLFERILVPVVTPTQISRTYYIPAFFVTGVLRDGRERSATPFQTIVPLVRDDQFSGS